MGSVNAVKKALYIKGYMIWVQQVINLMSIIGDILPIARVLSNLHILSDLIQFT